MALRLWIWRVTEALKTCDVFAMSKKWRKSIAFVALRSAQMENAFPLSSLFRSVEWFPGLFFSQFCTIFYFCSSLALPDFESRRNSNVELHWSGERGARSLIKWVEWAAFGTVHREWNSPIDYVFEFTFTIFPFRAAVDRAHHRETAIARREKMPKRRNSCRRFPRWCTDDFRSPEYAAPNSNANYVGHSKIRSR